MLYKRHPLTPPRSETFNPRLTAPSSRSRIRQCSGFPRPPHERSLRQPSAAACARAAERPRPGNRAASLQGQGRGKTFTTVTLATVRFQTIPRKTFPRFGALGIKLVPTELLCDQNPQRKKLYRTISAGETTKTTPLRHAPLTSPNYTMRITYA